MKEDEVMRMSNENENEVDAMQNYTAKKSKSEGGANSFNFDWQQKLIASFPIPNSANGQGGELANIEGTRLPLLLSAREEGGN
jgi:hypothetical protein